MTENPYARWLKIDFDLCLPVIGRNGLDVILEQVAIRVHQAMGLGPKPSTYLDLEQLQVADYSAFEGVSEEQRQFIAGLHTREPIRPEEMIFFALRSLFQFAWPKPTSDGASSLMGTVSILSGFRRWAYPWGRRNSEPGTSDKMAILGPFCQIILCLTGLRRKTRTVGVAKEKVT